MKNIFFYLLIVPFIASCSNEKEAKLTLADPDIQKIVEFQDTKNVKELIKYFVSPNMQLRERACIAFGSIQDTSALTSLYTMLEEDEEIAQAAAFAIGQTGSASSLPVLKRILERSMNEETRFEFFVAIGKCGGMEENYYLVSNYNIGKDPRGTAWALFYLSRNKFLNEAGIELAIKILENESNEDTRLGAAHSLARNTLDSPWKKILPLFLKEKNEDVKMALAKSLKGIDEETLTSDFMVYMKSCSANTQINFLSCLSNVSNDLIIDYCNDNIRNNVNINLQLASASYLSFFPSEVDLLLASTAIDSLNWRVRISLIQAVIDSSNDEMINYSQALYESSTNLYERGELVTILSSLPDQKQWLEEQVLQNDSILSTYGMDAFAAIMENENDEVKKSNTSFLLRCLASKNGAVITYSSLLFRDSLFMSPILVDSLKERLYLIPMPEKTDAFTELETTIRFLEGREDSEVRVAFNNPINLDSLITLEKISGFLVKTTKGDIRMKIESFDAPGTLMSIVKLVKEGYYDGKLFHRVVPNFVIQTGCPQGDGWGALDFSMRSEFTPLTYSTGAVGMASSGRDTESCQWFITHSPTPHLNGRYTIFAYLSEGMDVVQLMEVGDRIIEMKIINK
jgi:cyclophilin family peptidyl-prolyl cis-trans isomerase/HEAT repeat protein